MYYREDAEIMERIFGLSDRAVIGVINHMFQKRYQEGEGIIEEWGRRERLCVRLTVGGTDMYEYRLLHGQDCVQVQAAECGSRYLAGDRPLRSMDTIRDPGMVYAGENRQEQGTVVREYHSGERIRLTVQTVTLTGCSAAGLREMGMILFLPYLFYGFLRKEWEKKSKQQALRYLLIYEIPETLNGCLGQGEMTVYDVQKLKQACRRMAWCLLATEGWMKSLEMQNLVMETLDTDLDLLEQAYQTALHTQEKDGAGAEEGA